MASQYQLPVRDPWNPHPSPVNENDWSLPSRRAEFPAKIADDPDATFTAHRRAAPGRFKHEHSEAEAEHMSQAVRALRDDQYVDCFVTPGQDPRILGSCDSLNLFGISTIGESFFNWRHPTEVFIPTKHTHKGWSENHFPHPPRPVRLEKGPEIRHLDILKTWSGLTMDEAAELMLWNESLRVTLSAMLPGKLEFIDGYVVQIDQGLRGKDWPVFQRLPYDVAKVAEEMVKYVRGKRSYQGLFEISGDIEKMAAKFVRIHDCFTGGDCAAGELLLGVKVLPYGMRNLGYDSPASLVDVRWEPHYLSFDGTDWKATEGEKFTLIPKYNCAPMDDVEMSVEFLTPSVWLSWNPELQQFAGIMPFFSRPGLRAHHGDPTITCGDPKVNSYSVLITVIGKSTVHFGPNSRFEHIVRARITIDVLRKGSAGMISCRETDCTPGGGPGGPNRVEQATKVPSQLPLSESDDDWDPYQALGLGGVESMLALSEAEARQRVENMPTPSWEVILAIRRRAAKKAAERAANRNPVRRSVLPIRPSRMRINSASSSSWCEQYTSTPHTPSSGSEGATIISSASVDAGRPVVAMLEAVCADNTDEGRQALERSQCQGIPKVLGKDPPTENPVVPPSDAQATMSQTDINNDQGAVPQPDPARPNNEQPCDENVQETVPQSNGGDTNEPISQSNSDNLPATELQPNGDGINGATQQSNRPGVPAAGPQPMETYISVPTRLPNGEVITTKEQYFVTPIRRNLADRLEEQAKWIPKLPPCLEPKRPELDMEALRQEYDRLFSVSGMVVPPNLPSLNPIPQLDGPESTMPNITSGCPEDTCQEK
ncbi:hypothetical protein FQN49_006845 [Arthroderma sp. PD_2]|nr:hypothetical protein FQN49_006845 [Arthroderma sp. PD_2]